MLRAAITDTEKWHMPCFMHMQAVVESQRKAPKFSNDHKHLLTDEQAFHRGKDEGGNDEQHEKDRHGS